MSFVEVFMTNIKTESSNQALLRANQGVKVTSKLQSQQIKNAQLQFDFWTTEVQVIRNFKGNNQTINSTFRPSKI